MTLSTALSETLVRALRLPGPRAPGWYPLVAERAHRAFNVGNGVRTVGRARLRDGARLRRVHAAPLLPPLLRGAPVHFFKRWLGPGDVMLDSGAHVGFNLLMPKSPLRIALGTRRTLFNAVATHATARSAAPPRMLQTAER